MFFFEVNKSLRIPSDCWDAYICCHKSCGRHNLEIAMMSFWTDDLLLWIFFNTEPVFSQLKIFPLESFSLVNTYSSRLQYGFIKAWFDILLHPQPWRSVSLSAYSLCLLNKWRNDFSMGQVSRLNLFVTLLMDIANCLNMFHAWGKPFTAMHLI